MKKIKYISEIINFFDEPSQQNLLVLDIDNTILKSETFLGSDQWYTWQSILVKEQDSQAVADNMKHLNKIINDMFCHLQYQLCESDLPTTLSKLKKNNVEIILLTARGNKCHQNLKDTLLKFNVSQYLNTSFSFLSSNSTSYQDGIIYCSGSHKGKILKSFLEQNQYIPNQIVFVDDKSKNLEHVLKFLPQTHVFICTNQYENIWLFSQSDKDKVTQEYENYLKKYCN
tara:strand:+ start:382 stop:1065 length:684 start_codon:yes stop_codon:yes gene_type:complete